MRRIISHTSIYLHRKVEYCNPRSAIEINVALYVDWVLKTRIVAQSLEINGQCAWLNVVTVGQLHIICTLYVSNIDTLVNEGIGLFYKTTVVRLKLSCLHNRFGVYLLNAHHYGLLTSAGSTLWNVLLLLALPGGTSRQTHLIRKILC